MAQQEDNKKFRKGQATGPTNPQEDNERTEESSQEE